MSRLREPTTNKRLTNCLFVETANYTTEKDCTPPYTLAKQDRGDALSMYKIYMECDTEYEAAKVLLGDWDHWDRLTNAVFFRPYIEEWRTERQVRDEAVAYKTLMEQAKKGSVTAANSIRAKAKGRPSRKDIKEAAMKKAEKDNIIEIAKRRLGG